MCVLGLDTSNYTTSAAVFDGGEGRNVGRLLEVPAGALGLRQSEALFQHVKALPGLLGEFTRGEGLAGVRGVGASTRPREAEGSYMPCFLAGASQAEGLAHVLGVPFFAFSHQQGHLAAAAQSAGRLELLAQPLLAWHLSGGTTELLSVTLKEGQPTARRVGGSADLSAGQLIDRTGAALGLPFPAGRALDDLAREAEETAPFPVKLRGLEFSLSGVENQMRAHLEQGASGAEVARFVLETLTGAVLAATEGARRQWGPLPVLFCGGVAANSLLRRRGEADQSLIFCPPQYATDNALGIAVLTWQALERRNAHA